MKHSPMIDRLFRVYYFFKFYPFRKERLVRRSIGPGHGFVGIQIDGLSCPHMQTALAKGYLPNIERHLKSGFSLREYHTGLPSTTPAAQAAIFYGDPAGIPAFRWFEKETGRLVSCNDPDHVQRFREKLFAGRRGLLEGGSSYSNILDGGASRSIFTVSSPHPQTLFGRFGGLRFVLLTVLHPLRICRMAGATILEYFTDIYDRWHYRKTRQWRVSEGLFPFIRIFCNVILRELQTFGVIADVYAGVPRIYTTYSGYDELAHHFGPESRAALKNLRYTDKRIGEIMRMLRHAPGADYQLVILSDHGQTPGYPFHNKYRETLGDAISAFLKSNQRTAVSAGPLDFTRAHLAFIRDEMDARPHRWRYRIYRKLKDGIQKRISQLVPETIKIDPEGGVVITYSSSLAHLYITGSPRRLRVEQIEAALPLLLLFLSSHTGIGLVLARGRGDDVCCFHSRGQIRGTEGEPPPAEKLAFLRPYGDPGELWPQLCRLAMEETCGDLILFGAYDGEQIVCFDDQVGGHGSIGGEQSRPFVILPQGHPVLQKKRLTGSTFLYHEVFKPCVAPPTP